MAPSPTGLLHIGSVRTFLFNWLMRGRRAAKCSCGSNTDTSREVDEATEQIQRSLLGGSGSTGMARSASSSTRWRTLSGLPGELVDEGKAYEDDSAIRFRMPDEGSTGWDDVIRGQVDVPNESIEDLGVLRSDGRPTYNFANPVDDMLDGITHVIEARTTSRTRQAAPDPARAQAEPPIYAHVPDVLGDDGKKLSKRHGAQSVDDFRRQGYIPGRSSNSPRPARVGLRRPGGVHARGAARALRPDDGHAEPGRLRLPEALVAERRPPPRAPRRRSTPIAWSSTSATRASTGTKARAPTAPLVQRESRSSTSSRLHRFFFEEVSPAVPLDGAGPVLEQAERTLAGVEPFEAEPIEQELRSLAERLG